MRRGFSFFPIMTYCVAARLDSGLVFLSDSRTNAGVDQISVFRKMTVFERPGDRVMVLMTSGNLAVSQAVLNALARQHDEGGETVWNAPDMFEATRRVGAAVREVYRREAEALHEQGVEFNVSLIFGGQIGAENCRLFQVYSAGNFIEAGSECPYFQIGEAKYGKPILDRVLRPETTLDEAAKCALISMDSTLRSNISVGLPLDLLVYDAHALRVTHFASIDEHNEYFRMIRGTWGERLRQVFAEIPDPLWANPEDPASLVPASRIHQPLRAEPVDLPLAVYAAPQVLAEDPGKDQAN
jgi:putative proteasome-type protease